MSETGENIFNRSKEVRSDLEGKEVKDQDSIINADEKKNEEQPIEQEPIIVADGKTDLEKRTDEGSGKIRKRDKDIEDIITA
ncbi:MAG: hypothetical protein PHV25_02625 [Candidatus Pacebacteria bacterium]|nr:hypothetical protein [Candidatus Paceibacterota bacterium]